MNYFDIREFIIDPDATVVPIHVVHKIDTFHKPILNATRHLLGVPVIISHHSGYRTKQWELEHGRDGKSQHCYTGNGACDIRSNEKFDDLLQLLIDSDYTRVCYYRDAGFVHCDFKGEVKKYFEAPDAAGRKWQFKYNRDA